MPLTKLFKILTLKTQQTASHRQHVGYQAGTFKLLCQALANVSNGAKFENEGESILGNIFSMLMAEFF